ncbi:MAG: serine/threonine-protein kinase [Catenulispora sp.]
MDVMERYRLGGLIGQGATAYVYEAVDTVLNREVAVKVFRYPDVGDSLSQRFAEEVRILTSLVHPHLLPLLDAGGGAGPGGDEQRFIVTPLVRGTTLAKVIARGPVPPREVKRIGKAVAEALAHIHARGVVHRDVKPSNVLLAEDGTPYLADFGLAHSEDSPAVTATNCVVGTAGYLAPEQAEGLPVAPVADVYALGLVLLEALTGERAYRGTPLERAAANALRPPSIPARLGPGWLHVLRAMTTREPLERPTASEAYALLDRGEDELVTVTAFDDTMELTPVAPAEAAAEADRPATTEADAGLVVDIGTGRRGFRRRVAVVGAAAVAGVAVFGLGVGTDLLASGSASKTRLPGTTAPGAGATGPRRVTTPPSSESTSTTSTAQSSNSATGSPSTSAFPAQPVGQTLAATPSKCTGHGKHKCPGPGDGKGGDH